MARAQTTKWVSVAARGAAAGLAGAIVSGLFLYGAAVILGGSSTFPAGPQYLAVYAVTSIAWGCGYVYLADTRPHINKVPALSGIVFGLVVYVVDQLVLYSAAALRIDTAIQVIYGVVATTVFFGLPIGLTAKLLANRR